MIKFKIASFEDEAKFIFWLRGSLKNMEGVRNNPCIFLNLDNKFLDEIINSKKINKEIIKKIIEEAKRQSNEEIEKKLNLKLKKIKREWKKIEKEYFLILKNLTGIEIKNIICYITRFTIGSYFYPNKIAVNYKSDVGAYVIAEEIFHLYYWKICEKLFKIKLSMNPFDIKGKKWNAWHVSEVMPEYFLINNKKLKIFNKIDRIISYPWLVEIKKDIGEIKSDNFKDFIIKVHKRLHIPIH